MPQSFDQFIRVEIVDEDSDASPETSMIVSLPALPRWGDTLVLNAGNILTDDYITAVVTDVAIYTREASPAILRAYAQVFISYTRTREDLMREAREGRAP